MTEQRSPENAALRVLIDEIRMYQRRVDEHCRGEEKTHQTVVNLISEIKHQQQGFVKDIGHIHKDLDDIKKTIKPVPAQIAVLTKDMADHEKDITELRADVKVSEFLRDNAKWLIAAGLLVAGYINLDQLRALV